jgi:hypothetical protein
LAERLIQEKVVPSRHLVDGSDNFIEEVVVVARRALGSVVVDIRRYL